MAERYTTRARAKRIALDYFKRPHPFRTLKLALAIAAPVLALAWLVVSAARGDYRLYNSGPVSTGHALFGDQCQKCHTPDRKTGAAGRGPLASFRRLASDDNCLACHTGPVHHARQTTTPPCAGCHVEHEGQVVLASISDRHCTQCHENLQAKGADPIAYVRDIRSFADHPEDHPEFAIDRRDLAPPRRVRLDQKKGGVRDTAEVRDTADVKLNHERHLRPLPTKNIDKLVAVRATLAGAMPAGLSRTEKGVQLSCVFCHEADETRAYMRPITYARGCGPSCHELRFDRQFEGAAPHDTPEVIQTYLRGFYTQVWECRTATGDVKRRCETAGLIPKSERIEDEGEADQPRRLGRVEEAEGEEPDRPRRLGGGSQDEEEEPRRLGRGGDDRAAETAKNARAAEALPAQKWIAEHVRNAESRLFERQDEGCQKCHEPEGDASSLPPESPLRAWQFKKTKIPSRWLPHSRFDHEAHRPLACVECHGDARTSKATTDVLLPQIGLCRECHRPVAGARSTCVECHTYHDKSQEGDLDGCLDRQFKTSPPAHPARRPCPPAAPRPRQASTSPR